MNLQRIAKALKVEYFSASSPPPDILMVRFSEQLPSPAESQALSIVRLSGLLTGLRPAAELSFACIPDRPFRPEELAALGCHLLLFPPSHDEAGVFNSIQDLLDEELRFTENRIRLEEAIIQGQNPQQFIDLCADILGNAVVFSGKNTRLIARSQLHQGNGILWEEHGKLGRFSEDTIRSNRYQKMQKKLYNATSPVFLRKMISNYTTITGKVEIDNFQVGYFSVLDTEKPLEKEDKKLVAVICSLLTHYLKSNCFHGNEEIFRKKRKLELLLDENETHGWLDFGSEIADLRLEEGYRIMSIRLDIGKKSVGPLLTWIMKLLPDRPLTEYNNHIVLILNDLDGVEADRLDGFLAEHHLQAGISDRADCVEKFRECYRQSLKAIDLGRSLASTETRFYYSDYAVYHLWQTLSEYTDLTLYCHPAIPFLANYDKEHQTEFARTLRVFLINNGNMSSTAAQLSIHRASLLYRFEKLQELIKLDLEDAGLRAYLLASFQMLQIAPPA